MKEMTYTKQPNCITSFYRNENTENPDPKAVLLDSLAKFCIELDDFQKVAEKYLDDIEKKEKKGKKSV